jgi:hypothetical protein
VPSTLVQISRNAIDLTVPHMSGLDRAMRAYLTHDAKDLPVDVQVLVMC